jgi:hypothetical protein
LPAGTMRGSARSSHRRFATHASVLQLRPLASVHNLRRIDCVLIDLLFQDLPVFPNQEVHSSRGLVFIHVNSILTRGLAAPIAQQGKCNSNFIGEGFVGEGLSMLTPRTWVSVASSLFKSCWSACICLVQPPVNAKTKNPTTTFFFPRYWLSETSFKSLPSKYRSVKSGAMSPTFGMDAGTCSGCPACAIDGSAVASSAASNGTPQTFGNLFCI